MASLCHPDMRFSRFTLLWLALSPSLVACGDDSTATGGGATGGAGTGGDASGGGGGTAATPAIKKVAAPTRTTVAIELTESLPTAPEIVDAYGLTSARGPLIVSAVAYDDATRTITLTTEKQKLGIEYTLTVKSPGSPLDLKGGKFLAADTATFWATDFSNFKDYEVTASRVAIGEHVVIYATPEAEGASDVDETIAYFDTQIFPEETALFTAAPDRDDNGKVVLLGLDGGGYYGGYFNPLNALSDAEAGPYNTNEMELLYLSVPDLYGTYMPEQVVAHEFQHLLYNEAHDWMVEDWNWHNEGLAECAVSAVSGQQNEYAIDVYTGSQLANGLGNGESLVLWQYANYDQYAQAYMFWTYLASRLGGYDGYGALFDLTGSPSSIEALTLAQFGTDFATTQLDFLSAAWLQEASGAHSFNALIDFAGRTPQVANTAPVQLQPYTAVFLTGGSDGVTPAGEGPDVIFRGLTGAGTIQSAPPFDPTGGAVIALNAKAAPMDSSTEPSGTLGVALMSGPKNLRALSGAAGKDRAFLHPPPVKPANRRLLEAWRKAVHGF